MKDPYKIIHVCLRIVLISSSKISLHAMSQLQIDLDCDSNPGQNKSMGLGPREGQRSRSKIVSRGLVLIRYVMCCR